MTKGTHHTSSNSNHAQKHETSNALNRKPFLLSRHREENQDRTPCFHKEHKHTLSCINRVVTTTVRLEAIQPTILSRHVHLIETINGNSIVRILPRSLQGPGRALRWQCSNCWRRMHMSGMRTKRSQASGGDNTDAQMNQQTAFQLTLQFKGKGTNSRASIMRVGNNRQSTER